MHIVLGATGHVGSAVVRALLALGEPVTALVRDPAKAHGLRQKGAEVALADVHNTEALRHVFRRGDRLFLLNPPAAISTDTAAEERKSLASILAAIDGAGLEKIVAESTYGAQPGDRVGDLGVLYDMEQALAARPVPVSIIRAAYYMSNWDSALDSARREGKVPTLYPVEFKLPMVAPHDIGRFAARLMIEPAERAGLHYIEGPEAYSSADVAAAFAAALRRPVAAVETRREHWRGALAAMGFSSEAAESFATMTAATLEGKHTEPDAPVRGATSLGQYVEALVRSSRRGRGEAMRSG